MQKNNLQVFVYRGLQKTKRFSKMKILDKHLRFFSSFKNIYFSVFTYLLILCMSEYW